MASLVLQNSSCATTPPWGPLIVNYSSSQTNHNNNGDDHKLIHEGKVYDLGCLMLAKNRPKGLGWWWQVRWGHLSYLISLWNGFLPIHCRRTFYIEPYSPHQFSRQFRFCQGILAMLLEDPHTGVVFYEDALWYWKKLLFLGSMSQGVLTHCSLTLNMHVTLAHKN